MKFSIKQKDMAGEGHKSWGNCTTDAMLNEHVKMSQYLHLYTSAALREASIYKGWQLKQKLINKCWEKVTAKH